MLNERNTLLEDDGIEEEILVEEECSVAQAVWGDIQGNIENQTDLQNALDAKQDSLTDAQLNAVNSGITAEKVTTYDGYADQIASKADQSALNAEATTRQQADTALGRRIDDEAIARQQADNGLQTQIDAITSKSDVVDVVANYAALQAYDTSSLGNNDVIKVLDDETHEDALTYYRWSTTTQTWSYIGQEAPYYSKGQMDVKLAEKQDKLTAGANIQIQNGTISATDTTYTAGNGLNLNGTEFSADPTVLATKSDLDNYYTKTETDTKLAPKLEAELVAELPPTGEEGKLYLTPKAHTTQTATGNPITATVAEEAGAIESFKLDGDTFQQSYTGKNCIGFPDQEERTVNGLTYSVKGGVVTVNGTATSTTYTDSSTLFNFKEAGDITLSIEILGGTQSNSIIGFQNRNSQTAQLRWQQVGPSGGLKNTKAIDARTVSDTADIRLYMNLGSEFNNFKFRLMAEYGSTSTSFEPYVGGAPSPNPDYPQPIQTVTGLQTVSINGADYPLDLGTIELCKLGTYQDYIWKDGDSWKVHKATKKVKFEDVVEWYGYAQAPLYVHYFVDSSSAGGSLSNNPIVSSNFRANYAIELNSCFIGASNHRICFCPDSSLDWTTYIASKKPVVYYALATATDTTITDQTLIAQLEAIRTASLENGTNTITNSTPEPNLAGDMEVGYYGYNPTNRYDKFIWLDLNNNYEQIGS